MQVRDVMTGNVISVKADESIVRAASHAAERHQRIAGRR